MKDLKVGVVGGGVVGRATARTYLEHVAEVRVHDVVPERSTHSLDEVLGCDIVFVCLPTPQRKDRLSCDLSAVEEFFRNQILHGVRPYGEVNYVLRSTVPIGTTVRLAKECHLPNLVHSPEFLTARVAATDAHLPSRNIIGVPVPAALGESCNRLLTDLYSNRFPGVPVYHMISDESEAVKLVQNSFFAVKVAFFNEVRWLTDQLGLDWDKILRAVFADGRIAHSHTKVPGPDGQRGFGGTCLPKDLANLLATMTEHRLNAPLLSAALLRNTNDRLGLGPIDLDKLVVDWPQPVNFTPHLR